MAVSLKLCKKLKKLIFEVYKNIEPSEINTSIQQLWTQSRSNFLGGVYKWNVYDQLGLAK